MSVKIAKYWWAFLLRGLAAIAFGVVAIFWRGFTIELLEIMIGIYLFVEGILAIVSAFNVSEHENWWVLVIEGILGIIAGIVIFAIPELSLTIMIYVVAIWLLATSIIKIAVGAIMPIDTSLKWAFIVIGILTLIFALVMTFYPEKVISAMVLVMGIFAFIVGIGFVIFSFQLKKLAK